MSNQGDQIASIQAVTSTNLGYEGDWMALFDAHSIADGTFNERLQAWIEAKLATTFTDLPSAQQALAVDNGAYNWSSMGAFDATAP